jgi:hypothetical protein
MEGRTMSQWSTAAPIALALALLASGPAWAEPMYAWRTDDGAYSFTDDPDAIPERYRERATVRETGSLDDYRHFTPADGNATTRYQQELAQRLSYLRAVNGTGPVQPAPAPGAAGLAPTLTYSTANASQGGIELPLPASEEPTVVEQVWMRPRGSMIAQQVEVVRQGDRIVAINKPRSREWNPSDARTEEELLEEAR